MKIADGFISLGEACRKVTFSQHYDLTSKLDCGESDKPHLVWHTEGDFALKAVKLAASVAIVAGASMIAGKLRGNKR